MQMDTFVCAMAKPLPILVQCRRPRAWCERGELRPNGEEGSGESYFPVWPGACAGTPQHGLEALGTAREAPGEAILVAGSDSHHQGAGSIVSSRALPPILSTFSVYDCITQRAMAQTPKRRPDPGKFLSSSVVLAGSRTS